MFIKNGEDLKNVIVLPERRNNVCHDCGVVHDPEWMHDITSSSYRLRYIKDHGRPPNYIDAMAHCNEEVRDCLIFKLEEFGIDINKEDDPLMSLLRNEKSKRKKRENLPFSKAVP